MAAPPELCGIGEEKLPKGVEVLYQKGGKQQKSPWGQTTMGGPEKVPGSCRLGWNLELSNAAQGIWLEKRSLDNCLE